MQAALKTPSVAPNLEIRPNILIVDDRAENLYATEKVLETPGVNILKALSGEEALDILNENKIAVVLLDVQMPGMDGFETARRMQQNPVMQGVPIIFVTAINREDQFVSRAAGIGAVDYIFKPINTDILRSKVRVYLDLYRQREQILKLNEGLKQSNEELERFAFICSHDLKSPLRAIDNIAKWIDEDLGDAIQGDSRRYMDELHKRVRRMERLLDDTLEYARISSQKQQYEPEIVNGKVLIGDVLTLAVPPPGFTVEIAPAMAGLQLPRMPLQQIFFNLINNAFKHHGGKTGKIKVGVIDGGPQYIFSVRDDGSGIAPEYHQKIFEMFQTLQSRDKIEGSGMGLAFVKKILQGYGGSIEVESQPGKGAAFIFTWPR